MLGIARKSKQDLWIASWMATRPYPAASPYDIEYIQLAKQVRHLLENSNRLFRVLGLREQDYVDLSVILTCCFEDFINEVGLWKAFTKFNQETYGYWLPFYELKDYDTDYINPADIAFLMWHWTMQWSGDKKFLAPDNDLLMELAAELCLYFDERIEEVAATEFYDDYMKLPKGDDFFEVRYKLEWLAKDSYLFGRLGFAPLIQQKVDENAKSLKKLDRSEASVMAYDLELEVLYSVKCRFGGLRAAEWAARVFRGSKQMKDRLAGIQPKDRHVFKYLGVSGANYQLQHVASGRKLQMDATSVPLKGKAGTAFSISYIAYGKDIWGQGAALMIPEGIDPMEFEDSKHIPEAVMTPAERKRWLELPGLMTQAMQEVFGGTVVRFASIAEAEAGYQKVQNAANKLPFDAPTGGIGLRKRFVEGPLVMFVEPGRGISFCGETADFLETLDKPSFRHSDRGGITNFLFRKLHPVAVEYAFAHYPLETLIGWDGLNIDIRKYRKWLSAYFLPEGSGAMRPSFSVTG